MAEKASFQQIAIGSYIAQAAPGATAIINVYHHAPPGDIAPDKLVAAQQKLAELPLEVIPDCQITGVSGSPALCVKKPIRSGKQDPGPAFAASQIWLGHIPVV